MKTVLCSGVNALVKVMKKKKVPESAWENKSLKVCP